MSAVIAERRGTLARIAELAVEFVRLTRTGSNVNLLTQGAHTDEDIIPGAATEPIQISELAEASYGLGTHFVVDGSITPPTDGCVLEMAASYDYRGLAEDGLGNDMLRSLFVEQNSSFQFGVAAQNGSGNSTWVTSSHSEFFPVVKGAPVTFGLLLDNASGTELMRIRNARMKAGLLKK